MGAPLGPEFQVNTYTTLEQWIASVAADGAGNFMVVWPSNGQDGSGQGVFGQRYAPILPVELIHFPVE
jgi:large repetitive protein